MMILHQYASEAAALSSSSTSGIRFSYGTVHKEFGRRVQIMHGPSRHGLVDSRSRRSSPAHCRGSVYCSLRDLSAGHDIIKVGSDGGDHATGVSTSWQRPSSLDAAFAQDEETLHMTTRKSEDASLAIIDEERMLVDLADMGRRSHAAKNLVGLSEEMVKRISEYNNEPEWMLQFRLDAFHQLLAMDMPLTANCPPLDFHAMYSKLSASALDHRDQLAQQPHEARPVTIEGGEVGVGDDGSKSFVVGQRAMLAEAGVIFCTISDAIRDHPEMVRKYLGKVVAPTENFYAALNSAVFLQGFFCYVPPGVTCPLAISSLFLVDGFPLDVPGIPFERVLMVCDENAFVTTLEVTVPTPPSMTSATTPQLRAPVIELFCAAGGEIKHTTIQNWLLLEIVGATPVAPRDDQQTELLCNFVNERGLCDGAKSKITWTIVDTGSGVTWQHPAVVLNGDESIGECFIVTITDAREQADVGATMIHRGNQTRSRILGKTISADSSRSYFRGTVHVEAGSRNARSQAEWDAVLIGEHAQSTSCPTVVAKNTTAEIEEKGSTSRISKEQVFYFQQRGVPADRAAPVILSGFCDQVLRELPLEFESEIREMVAMKIKDFVKAPAGIDSQT